MKSSKGRRRGVINSVCVFIAGAALISALPFAFAGCSPRIIAQERTDSVRVEIRERIVHDTAFFAVPEVREVAVVRDTSSTLRNEWAESTASVDSLGFLHHSLETRPRVIRVPVTTIVHDTTIVEKEAVKETVEVNRLTPAQAAWVKIGKTLTAVLAVLVFGIIAIFAVKIYLKSKGL